MRARKGTWEVWEGGEKKEKYGVKEFQSDPPHTHTQWQHVLYITAKVQTQLPLEPWVAKHPVELAFAGISIQDKVELSQPRSFALLWQVLTHKDLLNSHAEQVTFVCQNESSSENRSTDWAKSLHKEQGLHWYRIFITEKSSKCPGHDMTEAASPGKDNHCVWRWQEWMGVEMNRKRPWKVKLDEQVMCRPWGVGVGGWGLELMFSIIASHPSQWFSTHSSSLPPSFSSHLKICITCDAAFSTILSFLGKERKAAHSESPHSHLLAILPCKFGGVFLLPACQEAYSCQGPLPTDKPNFSAFT